MNLNDWVISLALATSTTLILVGGCLPLSWWLARARFAGRSLIEAVLSLPLVLPPTVLGFYLLLVMSPTRFPGSWWVEMTGSPLAFSFWGILAASVFANIPFMLGPMIASFRGIDQTLLEAARCLGDSRWRAFRKVALPLAWPGIATGLVLTFAHSLGEFGVILMVGGNISGSTRTVSLAIYDDVQALDFARAHQTSLILLGVSVVLLAVVYAWRGREVGR